MSEDAGFIDGQATQNTSTGDNSNVASGQKTDATPENSQAGNSQSAAPKWKAQLPDDLKDNEALNQYDNIGALAKAVLDNQDGSKGELAVPDSDDAEAWGQLYDKLGRPSTPDEYKLEDSKIPEDVEANLRAESHKMGLTQKQFDHLSSIMGKSVETQKVIDEATFKGTKEACEQQLKQEFGDEYDANMNHMKRGADKFLTKDLKKALGMFGHLNNPDIAKTLVQMGKAIAEDVPTGGGAAQAEDKDDWGYPD